MTELSFQSISERPPQNLDAEESILGGILLDPGAIYRVGETLPAEAFYIEAHRKIYRAALALHHKRKPTNLMTVCSWLYDHKQLESVGGQSKLAQLVNRTVSAVNIDALADLVLKKYLRRCAAQLGTEIVHLAYESLADDGTVFDRIEEKVLNLTRSPYRQTESEQDYDDWVRCQIENSYSQIELTVENPGTRRIKLINLAKKFNLSINELENIYFKSLLADQNEPAMPLAAYRAKHGDTVDQFLLQGFTAVGKTSLWYGKGGVGKTRLIYHVAKGISWNGFPVTAAKRRVLLVQTDEAPNDTLSALENRGFTEDMFVFFKSAWTVDHIQQLDKEIVELGIDWVVIDSYTSVSLNSIFSENEVPYARPILLLKALAQKRNCHITIIHHANGEGKPRGTSAILNAVSDVFCISADPQNQQPDSLQRLLKVEKSRSRAPAIYELLYDPDDGTWSCLGKQGELEVVNPLTSVKDRLVDFFHNHRNIVYQAIEVHEEVGGAIATVRKCLGQLSRDDKMILSKRLPCGSKGYWLPLDGNELPQHSSPDRIAIAQIKKELKLLQATPDGSPADHPTDHLQDSTTESVSAIRDPLIPKNRCDTQLSTLENEDQRITDCQEADTQSVPQVIRTGDPQVIRCEDTDHLQSSLTIPTAQEPIFLEVLAESPFREGHYASAQEVLAESPFKEGDYVKEREGYRCGQVKNLRTHLRGSHRDRFYVVLVTVEDLFGEEFVIDPFYLEASAENESTPFACPLACPIERPQGADDISAEVMTASAELMPGAALGTPEPEVLTQTAVEQSPAETSAEVITASAESTPGADDISAEVMTASAETVVDSAESSNDFELYSHSLRSSPFKRALERASAQELQRVLKWSERDGDSKRIEILKKQLDQLENNNEMS